MADTPSEKPAVPSKGGLSPRTPPPRLRSTSGQPRRVESVYQKVALARGYTVKGGKATRNRLVKGKPVRRYDTGDEKE
jgi:hypothetical protein